MFDDQKGIVADHACDSVSLVCCGFHRWITGGGSEGTFFESKIT
jgi:hypothetical protein